jgi:hypothetical protein
LVFIFATILLPNDFLSNDVKKAAALNSLEPPYVWENGSSASTSTVRKILLMFVYTCYFVIVAVVVGAVGVGACVDIASGLVPGVPVVGPWPVLCVAVSVCVAYTLDLMMWWS